MTEDEAWDIFAMTKYDEEKVSPAKRSGRQESMSLTDERAIGRLCRRIGEARIKHPKFACDKDGAFGVIASEFFELKHAIDHESRERQVDEALDVAATCMRFIMGEHDAH